MWRSVRLSNFSSLSLPNAKSGDPAALPGQSYLGKSVQIKREAGLHDGLLHKFETPGHPLPSAASVLVCVPIVTSTGADLYVCSVSSMLVRS